MAKARDDAINEAAAEEEKKEEEVFDAYDISAAKDVLKDFGPDWIAETVALKKWDHKRD